MSDSVIINVLVGMYRSDGKLTAESVVDAARSPESPLHHRFEWDDVVAAHEYRLEQARALIREFEVVILETRVRRFTYVPSAGSYTPIEDAMGKPSWRAEILAVFERDARAFEAKWINNRFVADHYRRWKNTPPTP